MEIIKKNCNINITYNCACVIMYSIKVIAYNTRTVYDAKHSK